MSAALAADPRLARAVRERLASAYGSALQLIDRHKFAVKAVANRLLQKTALREDEVRGILTLSGDG